VGLLTLVLSDPIGGALPYDETEVRRAAHVATKRRQAAAVQMGNCGERGGHADSGQWFDSRNDGGDSARLHAQWEAWKNQDCGVTRPSS